MGDLKKHLKDGDVVGQAFALVAEHGLKTLNRFKAMLES